MNWTTYIFRLSLLLFASISLFACSKHEIDEDDCLKDGGSSEITVNLSVNKVLSPYTTVEIPDTLPTEETRAESDKILVYYLAAYRLYNGKLTNDFKAFTSSESNFSIALPIGRYRIFAWAQYVDSDDPDMKGYFHTDDFSDMLIRNKYSFPINDSFKIAYRSETDFAVSFRSKPLAMSLKPVMGQYKIEPLDSPDYEVGKVEITYNSGLAASHNAITDQFAYMWNGIVGLHQGQFADDCLAFDNVFALDKEHHLSLQIKIFDKNGKLKAKRNNISFPVVRSGITTVRAKVFTILEKDNPEDPGMGGINDEYDNTYFIELSGE